MSLIRSSLLRRLQALQGKKPTERLTPSDRAQDEATQAIKQARQGKSEHVRPEGLVVWACLPDLTESEALMSLIPPLRAEMGDVTLLLTTQDRHPNDAAPPDGIYHVGPKFEPAPIRNFLDHWQPDVVIWVHPEIDLVVLDALKKRGVSVIWMGAKIPQDRGLTQRFKLSALRDAAAEIDSIIAKDGASRRELLRLGIPVEKMRVTGLLQPLSQVPGCDIEERDRIAQKLDARPVWLAAGVDPSEENAILNAHRILIRKSHRLLLVLIPEDPARSTGLTEQLERDSWIISTRTNDDCPHRDDQIFVVDRADECELWMHLASITWIGGTLAGGANRNPLDPAALGSVVLFGPEGGRHAASLDRLASAGAARRVRDASTLAVEIEHLLAPDKAAEMAMAAWDVTTKGADVSEFLMQRLLDLLDEAESRKVF
ncbi:3-deoxy-D-manno-octulosonic acid transferase [Aliiroseovarius pelagivivens]|uniref:3-deoxy-D-manno-octulosonic acid transferase n=1 Tax=Aliiroseovarius pelagivivens TaxID=1639690 RepID=A0A2R8ASJ4_9RHOB|nr:glycosyltransferase N-terminal domain-containing protein [Aliiroseovarius pelagivivens]SPF78985.1 3-deoxy-D-manno-octulosonic acid transferase [Aliiroseovarius pelagivivens]